MLVRCMTASAAVELQLRSGFLFLLHSQTDSVQYKIDSLCSGSFVCGNAVVK